MKKLISLIAVILLCAAVFGGCNAGVISTAPETAAVATTAKEESETQTEKQKTEKKNKKESESSTEKESESTSSKQETTTKAETATEQEKDRQAKKKNKQKKNKKKKTSATESKELTCTITIECKDIYEHLDDLEEGYEAYLPSDGYILYNYTCSFNEGDTVYDVLLKAAQTKGIKVSATDTGYGKYINGINNINEKIAGKTSGWTYYVNDEFPMHSTDKLKVKKGDKIRFHYSCVYN